MLYLVVVSLVWAASFGLLKHRLAGIHPDLVNLIRMLFALGVFLPWLIRPRSGWTGRRRTLRLVAIGAVQFGAMYALYNRAFAFLAGHQVAIATVLTPLYVTLFDDLLGRRIRWRFLACALLSVGGTAVSLGAGRVEGAATGLLLLQAANVCFAVGQVAYRRTMAGVEGGDAAPMARAYVGGAAVVALAALPQLGGLGTIRAEQWLTLAWLGAIGSGLCFFLWNAGARRVNTGVLAVMNDLKIPLGVLVSLLFFGEEASWPRLLTGMSVVALAGWLAHRVPEREGEVVQPVGEVPLPR